MFEEVVKNWNFFSFFFFTFSSFSVGSRMNFPSFVFPQVIAAIIDFIGIPASNNAVHTQFTQFAKNDPSSPKLCTTIEIPVLG